MAHEFSRGIRDAFWQVTQALPNQNTNNSSGSMDLKTDAFKPEDFEVEIDIPATPSLANGQTLTFLVQDSADNSSFASISGATQFVLTGGASGAAAQKFHFRVPSNARQYSRVNTAASATAGDSTAVSLSLRLVF